MSKKRLTTLDMLLLTFVKHGLATTYDLQSQAGISVGRAQPALLRLKLEELVRCEDGPRRSVRYTITEKGAEELQEALTPELIDNYLWLARFGTFHVAARITFLAWQSSQPDSGERYVRWAIEALYRSSRRHEDEARRYLLDIEDHLLSSPKMSRPMGS